MKISFKKYDVLGNMETEKDYDINEIIKAELEKTLKEKTEELSNKYFRKIKTEFYLEIK